MQHKPAKRSVQVDGSGRGKGLLPMPSLKTSLKPGLIAAKLGAISKNGSASAVALAPVVKPFAPAVSSTSIGEPESTSICWSKSTDPEPAPSAEDAIVARCISGSETVATAISPRSPGAVCATASPCAITGTSVPGGARHLEVVGEARGCRCGPKACCCHRRHASTIGVRVSLTSGYGVWGFEELRRLGRRPDVDHATVGIVDVARCSKSACDRDVGARKASETHKRHGETRQGATPPQRSHRATPHCRLYNKRNLGWHALQPYSQG